MPLSKSQRSASVVNHQLIQCSRSGPVLASTPPLCAPAHGRAMRGSRHAWVAPCVGRACTRSRHAWVELAVKACSQGGGGQLLSSILGPGSSKAAQGLHSRPLSTVGSRRGTHLLLPGSLSHACCSGRRPHLHWATRRRCGKQMSDPLHMNNIKIIKAAHE